MVVHIHDVFLPGDYPPDWVLDGWGLGHEIYLVHAFLAFNRTFEVVYGAKWMELHARDVLLEAFPGLALPEHAARSGSSLWIRRVGPGDRPPHRPGRSAQEAAHSRRVHLR